MSSLNKVCLIGNLGKDPEIRRTQDGRAIANLNIATSETWTDKKTGERREKVDWHRVVCFNEKLSEIIEKYLKKGSKVYIEGKLQTRKWVDQAGVDRYVTEVVMQGFDGKLVMLSTKENGSGAAREKPSGDFGDPDDPRTQTASDGPRANMKTRGDMDNEIPFGPEMRV